MKADIEIHAATMQPGAPTVVRDARPDDGDDILRVLTDAFRDDPATQLLVGSDEHARARLDRLKAASRREWERMNVLVAERDGRILGVLTYADSPACHQLSWRDGITFTRALGRRLFSRELLRAMRLFLRLSRVHPKSRHRHLPAIGIDPMAQRQGVGGRLMEEYARRCDAAGLDGYLETHAFADPTRPSHRRFYERYGFRVADEIVMGGGWSMITMVRPTTSAEAS